MAYEFRKNAQLVTSFSTDARVKEPTAADPYVLDGYELHAHPDLFDRLRQLVEDIPGVEISGAFGIPVAANSAGRIFAFVIGTHYVGLYLPDCDDWGTPYNQVGTPWRTGFAWAGRHARPNEYEQQLRTLMHHAYEAVTRIDAE